MGIKYTFSTENWHSLGSYRVVAVQQNRKQIPIVPQDLPFLVEGQLIAAFITCSQARITWNWGGFALQRVNTALTVGGTPDATYSWHKLYLNEINLIEISQPRFSSAFRFLVPKYFPSWECFIWEYGGPIVDDIQIIKQLATQIDQKVS
jgi:hypothetical protein